jgi:hypothetical protein
MNQALKSIATGVFELGITVGAILAIIYATIGAFFIIDLSYPVSAAAWGASMLKLQAAEQGGDVVMTWIARLTPESLVLACFSVVYSLIYRKSKIMSPTGASP